MFTLYQKDYYKQCICLGLVNCIIFGVILYFSSSGTFNFDSSLILLSLSLIFTLYYLTKFLMRNLNYVIIRIDDSGVVLCSKRDEGVCIPWEKIRHVIFVLDNNCSKIIIRQYDKETHYLELTKYYHCFRPKKMIEAAYEYADDKKKIIEVKDYLHSSYEEIMWNISKTEVKHAIGNNTTEANGKSKKKKSKGKSKHRKKLDKQKKGDSSWKSLLLWAILLLAVVNITMWVEDTCLHTLLPICIPWMYYLFILVIAYVVLELTLSYFSISRKNVAKRHTFSITFSFKCVLVLVVVPALIFLPNRYIQIGPKTEHQGVVVDKTTWSMLRTSSSTNYVKIRLDAENTSFWYNTRNEFKPLGRKCMVLVGRGLFGMRYVERVDFDGEMP